MRRHSKPTPWMDIGAPELYLGGDLVIRRSGGEYFAFQDARYME